MRRTRNLIIIIVGLIVLLFLFIIPICSFLAKFLLEKYDVQYTGREITLDWAYVNPFTGYVHFDDLIIYEAQSDTPFISMEGLSVNVAVLKLLSNTYEIEKLKLSRPFVHVVDGEEEFNFADLIEKFTPDSTKAKSNEETRFNLLNIEIEDGVFYYDEVPTPVNYFIEKVNLKSTGYRYDQDTIPLQFSFSSGVGSGEVEGDITLNVDNQEYRMAVKVDSFDLEVVNQYLKDLTNYGTFAAMLDAEINSTGNFSTIDSMSTTGKIMLSNFHFGKSKDEDFASFEQLVIDIVRLSPKDFIYHYDSISLTKPFIQYEKYDVLDNFQTMFGAGGENVASANANPDKFNLVIEVAKFIQRISRNLLSSPYKVGRLAVYDGDIQYSDYSLGEKFHVGLYPFSLHADSLDKERSRIKVNVESGIKPHGEFWVALSINPLDSSYFDLDYRFHKIPLTLFNPYLKTYTSFPLDRGSFEFVGNWRVRAGDINSDNHIIIIDPRVADRVKNKDTKWIPVPLAMAFIRERGNVIDYTIPVKGNLNDPKFNFWDVVTDLLKNIFIKPVTLPYRTEVKNVEQEIEKSLSMKWDFSTHKLSSLQEKFIEKMIDFLKENPEATISIIPTVYSEKEREFFLLFEAKKKFYLTLNKLESKDFTENDSIKVQKMSIKNYEFLKYLDAQVNTTNLFTVQQKAARLISPSLLATQMELLSRSRKTSFLEMFKEEKLESRVKFQASINTVPFNGFSFYDINYKGDFPDYLREAHNKMYEWNRLAPREKYKERRKKIPSPEL